MKTLRHIAVLASFVVVMSAQATITAQMNLEQLVNNSARVFVGEVVSLRETRVAMGGGEVPAVTYRLRVSETFKGEYEQVKELQFAEVTMVGALKHVQTGRHPISDFPVLSRGTEYLLFVAPEGPTGLTATMGLGQGCFHLSSGEEGRVALNLVNNAGLFAGMNVGIADNAPVSYAELADMIRAIAGGAQ